MKTATPHERCKMLDNIGDAYWLRLISWTPAEVEPGIAVNVHAAGDFEILAHSPEWVELSAQTIVGRASRSIGVWRRWSDLGAFQICEEGD